MNSLHKVEKIAKAGELEKLLPQNLDADLFERMMEEIAELENDMENANATLIVFSVLTLASSEHGFGTSSDSFTIEERRMFEMIDFYVTSLKLEKMRRSGQVTIDESTLPTVENIFDRNRKVTFLNDRF